MLRSSKFHLAQVGETYSQHLRAALEISAQLVIASAACALHALVPGLCTRSASSRVAAVHAHLSSRSDRCEDNRPPLAPRCGSNVEIEKP